MTNPELIATLKSLAEKARGRYLPDQVKLANFVVDNVDAILAMGRERDALREAALGLQQDLLNRADWCPDAGKVVCAGNGAWFRFCQALEGDNQ